MRRTMDPAPGRDPAVVSLVESTRTLVQSVEDQIRELSVHTEAFTKLLPAS